MNITDVRVRKVAKEGKMKAVVSITIDDEFVVHDIKVIEHRQFCLKGILKAEIYVEYEGLAFISATKPTSRGLEDATDHLPSGDFKRLDSMLNWVETDDMVYIESWEDIRL